MHSHPEKIKKCDLYKIANKERWQQQTNMPPFFFHDCLFQNQMLTSYCVLNNISNISSNESIKQHDKKSSFYYTNI